MATRAGVGRSANRRSRMAARSATERACASLGGASPEFCLVFAGDAHDHAEVLAGVAEAAPGAAVSGCSAEGIIGESVSDESESCLSVLAVRSDTLRFEPVLVKGFADDAAAAGRELAAAVAAGGMDDALGLLVLPDGLAGDSGRMIAELEAALPRPLTITGGTAGDALLFQRSFQYRGTEVARGAVAAVVIRGRGRIETAVSHGCEAVGLERTVTDADGGWVRRIDGEPAWSIFREYLDGEPEDLNTEGAIYLSIGVPFPADDRGGYEPFLIRTPVGLDKPTGSLFFPAGGFRAGDSIRIMRRDPDMVCRSAQACARRIAEHSRRSAPAFVIQFDCAGRGRQLFGSRASENIVQPLQAELPHETPWIGFHTFGEIAPVAGRTRFHNLTTALCAVFDEP